MRTAAPRLLASFGLVVVALLLVGCFGDDSSDQPIGPTSTPDTGYPPETAIGFWVRNRLNQGFVPNCDDAKRPQDNGKQCARFLDRRTIGSTEYLAYGLGPVFSFPSRIFVLQPAADSWTLVKLQELDPNNPVPGIPWPITVGANLVVAGTGDCLFVRERPGTGAADIECLPDGTPVTVEAGPIQLDGLEWWQLAVWKGWSVSDYLRYPEDVPEDSGA